MDRRRPSRATAARRPRVDWPSTLLRACRLIETADDEATSNGLTHRLETLGVSIAELQRQFRRHLGTTPKAYLTALRINRLARSVATGGSALDATLRAGFGSTSRGYVVAAAAMGEPPGRLRHEPAIGYWLGLSALGWMLMGANRRGICWLAFGDNPQQMLAELQRAYPHATCTPTVGRLRAWYERVREHILLPDAALRMPVDVQGTAFQARVWRALQRIPLGETRSYAEIARCIRRPTAIRAVAAACATNEVALLIPCHRVVASNGALAGYRWGKARKQALLDSERRRARRPAQIATSTAGSRRL